MHSRFATEEILRHGSSCACSMHNQYSITSHPERRKANARHVLSGRGEGGGDCLPGTSWTLVQLACCGMPRSCPSHAAFWGRERRTLSSNTLSGGREGWRDVGREGGSGGRVQLKHESLQGGDAVVDVVVRIHFFGNPLLQGAAVLVSWEDAEAGGAGVGGSSRGSECCSPESCCTPRGHQGCCLGPRLAPLSVPPLSADLVWRRAALAVEIGGVTLIVILSGAAKQTVRGKSTDIEG